MEQRTIFLYWIGQEYKLIGILRQLIYLHSTNGKGYKVILITDKNIKEYVKDIPSYYDNMCPAHQADFVRVNVICEYGGIWLDSDTLVLDSLDTLFDYIENKNGFFIKENNIILWNGIFGSKSNTPLMIEWKTEMIKILDNNQGKINWSAIGCQLLQTMYNINPGLYHDYNIFNGLDNMYPVNWNNCVTEFIDTPYENYKTILREYQPLVVLVNSVYKKLEDKTDKEILEGNMPINYFINKSFENISNINKQPNVLALKKVRNKYVIYTDWIESYLTKESFKFVEHLKILGWTIIKLSNIEIETIKNTKCVVLCVTYDDFDISLIKCDNVQIIYKIDDLYPYKDIRNKCINSADIIISPYQYLFNNISDMYTNINLSNTIHIPYSAVDDFFKDIEFNNKPINKIFVSGRVSDVYPLKVFIKNNAIFTKYIDCLNHPSYGTRTHECVNEVYYKKLNNYLCCFVDALLYKYVLLKVFETCSVGSLLFVEDTIKNELNNLGFYDNINCIMCNKNNLENKLKWILNIENRQLVDDMRKNGMVLVRQTHTTQKRSEQINNFVNN